jgi:hypothetical protein
METSLALNIAATPTDVFDSLDVAESTRTEYKWRIQAFVAFLGGQSLTVHCYLQYKRYLGSRTDLSISCFGVTRRSRVG